jgi:hypothetical protein
MEILSDKEEKAVLAFAQAQAKERKGICKELCCEPALATTAQKKKTKK